jgi:hypothetical protein
MNKWEQEVSITLTKSDWLELVLGLWDRRKMIEGADTTEEVKDYWDKEVGDIQRKIRLAIAD